MMSNLTVAAMLGGLLLAAACEEKPEKAGGGPSEPEPTATPTKTFDGAGWGAPGSWGSTAIPEANGTSPTSGTTPSPRPTDASSAAGEVPGNGPGRVSGSPAPGIGAPGRSAAGNSAAGDSAAGNSAAGNNVAGNNMAGTGRAKGLSPAPCKQMWVFDTGGNGAVVHAGPAPNTAGIDTVTEGQVVQALGLANEKYVAVQVGGKAGYMAGLFLTCAGDRGRAAVPSSGAAGATAGGASGGSAATAGSPAAAFPEANCTPAAGPSTLPGVPPRQGAPR